MRTSHRRRWYHPDVVRRALLLTVISAVAFGVMAYYAKVATRTGLGGAEVAAVRFAFGLVPLLLVTRIRRAALRWQRRDLLLYRGVFGGTAVLLYFLTIDHVPVGLATLLNYMAPVFSTVFAARFIGEPVRARALPPLVLSLVGVLLVVRSNGGAGGTAPLALAHAHVAAWSAVGLLSAILSGAAVTAIRAARRTESSWAVYTSMNAVGLLATLPFALPGWRWPTSRGWAALLGVGVFALIAQLLMTYAYRWVNNLQQGVLAQLAVFVAVVMGAAFLHEPLDAQSALGSLLTVACVIAVVAAAGGGAPAPAALDS